MRIAVAGTGYVGLSLAVLLSQHHEVKAVDIIQDTDTKFNYQKDYKQEPFQHYLSRNVNPSIFFSLMRTL